MGASQEGLRPGRRTGLPLLCGQLRLPHVGCGVVEGYFLAEGAVRFPGTRQDSFFTVRDGAVRRALPAAGVISRRRISSASDPTAASTTDPTTPFATRSRRVTGGYRIGRKVSFGVERRLPRSVDRRRHRPAVAVVNRPLPDRHRARPQRAAADLSLVFEPYVEITTIDRPYNEMSGGRYKLHLQPLQRPRPRSVLVRALGCSICGSTSRSSKARARLPCAPSPRRRSRTMATQSRSSCSRRSAARHTLRGFRSFRFRDESALLLQAEYRWRINELIAGALFYDTGAVARRLSAISARSNATMASACGSAAATASRSAPISRLAAAMAPDSSEVR